MPRIRLAIAVLSARHHGERRARCRRLWTHALGGRTAACWRFFVGRPAAADDAAFSPDLEPDVAELDCSDDYAGLPQKTRGALRWFLERYEFDHLFKCDDDTYVRVDRLLGYAPPGEYCGWSVRRGFPGAPDVANGGAGYLLTRRAAGIAAQALEHHRTGAEDELVGRGLAAAGISLHHDERFRWNADPGTVPAPGNDGITAHWIGSPEAEAVVRRPWAVPSRPAPAAPHDLVLRVGSRTIRWIIGPAHDRAFTERVLLPWAAPTARRLPPETRADFTVGVYPTSNEQVVRVREAGGTRFILSGEPEARYARGEGCFQFVQDPRPGDDEWTRYAPMLCIWTPPVDGPTKSRPCSVIDSKRRPRRAALFDGLKAAVPDLDGFGSVYGRPLGGYHCVGPDPKVFSKHEGLASYAFNGCVERTVAFDYLTEKFTDAILCETVPLYSGCRNLDQYAVPGSYHPIERADELDWANWGAEYRQRRPAVLRQKELVRSHFNVLSFFVALTGKLDLMDQLRPITLSTIGAA